MPPPTAANTWLNSRRFGIVVDAGSSGSRLQIYSWRDPSVVRQELGEKAQYSLPKVEKGTPNDEDWVAKAEPGLSSFANDLDGIPTYLAPLLEHARTHIPPSLQRETPLFLLATAGMRLLTPEQQADVLETTCRFLRFHSNFRIEEQSEAGPCGRSVRIITGEEEGLFGWIAVNYLMDGFGPVDDDRATYGFLDMGGASTQIAFEPSLQEREKAKNLVDVRLRMMGGGEVHHQVFVTTWLGYGTNQARERYVGRVIHHLEDSRPTPSDSPSDIEVLEDPCLPKNLRITETPIQIEPSSSHAKKPHTLIGTGSFDECLKQTAPLLNKAAPCPDTPCLFNGVYVPPIDFSVSRFIGVSEYWYSSEHIFGLGGAYDFVQYERAAEQYCGNEWDSILQMHEDAKQRGRFGGVRQLDVDGVAVGLDKWGDQVEISRLQMQCFKAAWVVNVLHEGLGMPRIVDPGGNSTTDGDVKHQADRKGLGPPTFQSMDSVDDIAITWTLGKMVLEASNDVPP
ncbi:nucleoside phosphatase family-domain-containing protein, partial [Amylostereum chailletii]